MSARYPYRKKVVEVPAGVKADVVARLLDVIVDAHDCSSSGSYSSPVVRSTASGSIAVYSGGLRS